MSKLLLVRPPPVRRPEGKKVEGRKGTRRTTNLIPFQLPPPKSLPAKLSLTFPTPPPPLPPPQRPQLTVKRSLMPTPSPKHHHLPLLLPPPLMPPHSLAPACLQILSVRHHHFHQQPQILIPTHPPSHPLPQAQTPVMSPPGLVRRRKLLRPPPSPW